MIYPNLPSKLMRRTAALALLSLATTLPLLAQASTLCEKGRIDALELSGGGNSVVVVRTEKTRANESVNWAVSDHRREALGYPLSLQWDKFGTRIWHNNEVRWRDRLSLLRTAMALQQPIVITSSDYNCQGPSDEFTISLCLAGDPSCT